MFSIFGNQFYSFYLCLTCQLEYATDKDWEAKKRFMRITHIAIESLKEVNSFDI